MTTPYIRKLEVEQEKAFAEHVKISQKIAKIEGELRPLKRQQETLFHKYHDLRGKIDAEREMGYPHGRRK